MNELLNRLRLPYVALTIAFTLLFMIGSALGWFDIGNELARRFAEDELRNKELTTALIGFASLSITIASVAVNKPKLAFIAAATCLYATLLINNQMPDEDIKATLSISVSGAFWLSLLSAFAASIGNAMIGVKGFLRVYQTHKR